MIDEATDWSVETAKEPILAENSLVLFQLSSERILLRNSWPCGDKSKIEKELSR